MPSVITQLQDELDVVNVQLVELRTKHELVETQLAVCKQAEVEHIIANSELSARISDEQERATQLEGALAKIQGEHLEVTVADLRQQLIIAKIQGEHLGVTVADLRQRLITATAVAEQAAAQVAAKDASLVEVSKLANKHILPRFCPRCATPVQNNLEIREFNECLREINVMMTISDA